MADLLSDPTDDVEEILRDACGHLARSLDLLSRVVHPPPPAGLGPISVREPIAFIADLHRSGRTHVLLELEIDQALPAATGIGHHLEHALLNLLLHATDCLRQQDAGTVRIAARAQDDGLCITVGWNGPPVPPGLAAELFEMPATTQAEHPLAVGLPVAHEVIRRSGGTLAYSADAGPSFVVTLPRWIREHAPDEQAGSR